MSRIMDFRLAQIILLILSFWNSTATRYWTRGRPIPTRPSIKTPYQFERVKPNPSRIPIQGIPTVSSIPNPVCQQEFCTEVPDYPENFIRSKLKISVEEFRKKFGADSSSSEFTIANEGGKRICSSIRELSFPRVASNIDNEQKYIVNVDNYVQGIQIEKCRIEGGECEEIQDNLPFGYKSECKQLYLNRSLMSVNPGDNNNNLQIDRFRMPSACVCFLKLSADFAPESIPSSKRFPQSPTRPRPQSNSRRG